MPLLHLINQSNIRIISNQVIIECSPTKNTEFVFTINLISSSATGTFIKEPVVNFHI